MKHPLSLSVLVITSLCMVSAASALQGRGKDATPQNRTPMQRAPMHQDRPNQRDRLRERVPAQDQDKMRERDQRRASDYSRLDDGDIFGGELMTERERNTYRKRLQSADSPQARRQIEAQHRETIQNRSREQGVTPVPAGAGIYRGDKMTVEERNQYREQMRNLESDEERAQFIARHREQMQMRERNVEGPESDDDN